MAVDVKKIQSLTEQSLADLKTIEKLGGLEHLAELNNELKKALDGEELANLSPMLPPYFSELRKNIGFMLGNYKAIQTHAVNRNKELNQLMDQLSHIK
ncbi:hypothetical protein [Leuconostoc gelidum]|uniref:hypothetical protein n=1 Tax=Leuconostoc gelidum TaxID=1244 RepID=UPI001C7D41D7|nr:hypothetical protein [Leuconostoc gelidum]MBZ6010863.1 hypothetical protein [Leuconostoc gelidum subsp. aenigmaticum]